MDRQASQLALNVLANTENTISVGVQMTYASGEGNDGIAVKKNKASQFKNNPITINNVAVYIEFGNVGGEEEVTMAVSIIQSYAFIGTTVHIHKPFLETFFILISRFLLIQLLASETWLSQRHLGVCFYF